MLTEIHYLLCIVTGGMKGLREGRIARPLNLRFCHYSDLYLRPPSLALVPLTQFQTLRNSICQQNPLKPCSTFSSGSIIKAQMASSSPSTGSEAQTKPFSVLFVCLGNICRSPAAEGVFRNLVKKRALDSKFKIDSAGTIDYHEGNEADPRMRAASKRRAIEITSLSRPIRPSDFREFDLILAMDEQNRDDILYALNKWKSKESIPDEAHKKVKLMCFYCKRHDETEVPDPYYGGPQGFEKVLDLLEDACESLLDSILVENQYIFDG